jgi:hypothetical protein
VYRLLRHPLALLALVALCGATLPRAAGATAAQPLPRADLLAEALAAYRSTASAGLVRNPLLTVVDYALPSSQRRLWVIEPETGHVRFHEFGAHGRGSSDARDPDRAVRFGNEPASQRSSLGTFLTGPTYTGQHGHSLELSGLEAGVNDRAFERRIVIHPAAYVGSAFRAASGGRVGRSFGCPALDPSVSRAVIDTIQGGSVLYAGSGALLAHTR